MVLNIIFFSKLRNFEIFFCDFVFFHVILPSVFQSLVVKYTLSTLVQRIMVIFKWVIFGI